jgi:tight adherence protein B
VDWLAVTALSWLAVAGGCALLANARLRSRGRRGAGREDGDSSGAAGVRSQAGTVRRWSGPERLQAGLARAGLRDVTPRDFALVSGGLCLLAGLAAQLVFGWALVSLVAAAAGLAAPAAYYARREARRRVAVQEALAEAVDRLRQAQAARLSLQSGLEGLARSGPPLLRADFARFGREQAALGFPAALGALQARLADPVWDAAALALLVNHRLGSRQVGPLLARLAAATRAELGVRAAVRAQQAQHETSARIVAAVPVVVLVGLRLLNPAYVAVFDAPLGQVVLAGCAAMLLAGYAAMRHAARLPDGRRVVAALPTGTGEPPGIPGLATGGAPATGAYEAGAGRARDNGAPGGAADDWWAGSRA